MTTDAPGLFSKDELERIKYETELLADLDHNTWISDARIAKEEAREEGREEG